MTRGGKREGAGRKPGSLKKTPFSDRTEQLGKRITKEEKVVLVEELKRMRGKGNEATKNMPLSTSTM